MTAEQLTGCYSSMWNDQKKIKEELFNVAVKFNKIDKNLRTLREEADRIRMAIQQDEIRFKEVDEVGKALTKRLMELEQNNA